MEAFVLLPGLYHVYHSSDSESVISSDDCVLSHIPGTYHGSYGHVLVRRSHAIHVDLGDIVITTCDLVVV